MNQSPADYHQPEGQWERFVDTLRQQPRWVPMLLVLAMMAIIGSFDYATGWEVSLFVFYALPILLAVWVMGHNAALLLALLGGPIWWVANAWDNPYETAWGYHWAMISRVIYFAFVAIGGTAIRSKQEADASRIEMLEEMRQLQMEIVSVSEHEQQRIGQDLHDGLCQQLAAISCATRSLADDLQAQVIPEAQDAEKIGTAIQQAMLEARGMARGIFPVHVDRSGLSAALSDIAQTTQQLTGLPIVVTESAEVEVDDPEVAMHLYRIAQEAVANAVRHSAATKVVMALEAHNDHLELSVRDNGRGFAPSERKHTGMGLRTMHYRAQAMGADLAIEAPPEGGTAVLCRLKVRTNPPDHNHGQA